MSFHVIHFTKPARDSREALPCVHDVRLVMGGRFTYID